MSGLMVSFHDNCPNTAGLGVTGITVMVGGGCEGTEQPGSREGMPAMLGFLLTIVSSFIHVPSLRDDGVYFQKSPHLPVNSLWKYPHRRAKK